MDRIETAGRASGDVAVTRGRTRGARPWAVALLIAVMAFPAIPAEAALGVAERVVLPPQGNVTVVGRGYGHGIGMSQYGARGAASTGVGYGQILDFYYPGTAMTSQAAAPIRVRIAADTDNDLRVVASGTMTATDASGTSRALSMAGATQWRVVRRGGGMGIDGLVGGAWRDWNAGILSMPVTVASSTGTVRVVLPDGTQREYRGTVRAVVNGAAPATASVNVVAMEDYLRSVIPAEMPASWPGEALRAQAVAARTYASRDRSVHGGDQWDTCDTTSCQVYAGWRSYTAAGALASTNEYAATDTAVAGTANQVRTYGGALAFTQFSSSNGGWTAQGSAPYLVARQDPWDAINNPVHAWSLSVSTESIRAAYPQVGAISSVTVTSRDGAGTWGGRVASATITGSAGSVTVTGPQFRTALGLRSGWWKITGSTRLEPDWSGDGRPDLLGRTPAGALIVYEGTGTGGFATAARQVGRGWQSMRLVTRIGDLTGDGVADLVAVGDDGRLWRYPATGTGGFAAPAQIGSGWQSMTRLIAPGDMTSDGRVDLLAIDVAGRMWLYPGNGNGGVGAGRQVGSGWQTMTAVLGAGDMNDDGRADILARTASGDLLLYPGRGDGGIGSPTQVGRGWSGMTSLVVVGDWSGDGRPDVMAVSQDGQLLLYPWLGRGFGAPTRFGYGWGMYDLLL